MNPVATTGLLVAAIRAEETRRTDRLFEDPFADALAGEAGRAALAKYRAAGAGPSVPIIEVRTRWYDDAVARALSSGLRQVVILAAGMDSRSYRLSFPEATRVFELDQPAVIEHKRAALAGATARCERIALGCDLAQDWSAPLEQAGFNRDQPTLWLVEGLLQYLDASSVTSVLSRVDELSRSGSVALYDVVGESLLRSPVMASTLHMMRELGAPWIFGSDEPAALLPAWRARVTEPAIVGNELKRWPFPVAPTNVPGVPRGYLIEAFKP
jgi:methyltransferase (TIGR00027 family)